MEFSPYVVAGGFLLSLATFAWGIVAVLDRKVGERHDRMETRHQEEMNSIKREHDSIRKEINDNTHNLKRELKVVDSRVNEVKELYVTQNAHDRDISNLRESLTQFRTEIKQDLASGIAAFNGGLDAMRRDFTEYLMKLSNRNNDNDSD